MVDKKIIGISTLTTLGLILASMIIPGFFDEPKYYCESRMGLGLIQCDDFSKYVDPNGKCIRFEDTNLICRDGWKLVIDDRALPEEIEESTSINKGIEGKSYLVKQGQEPVEIIK